MTPSQHVYINHILMMNLISKSLPRHMSSKHLTRMWISLCEMMQRKRVRYYKEFGESAMAKPLHKNTKEPNESHYTNRPVLHHRSIFIKRAPLKITEIFTELSNFSNSTDHTAINVEISSSTNQIICKWVHSNLET